VSGFRFSSPPRRLAAALCLGFAVFAAGAVGAARAPNPARAVSPEVYSGRWYEVARTPNKLQKDCQRPTSDFMGFTDGVFEVVESCHRGGPDGPLKTIKARAKVVSPRDNTRFRMSFFGGLVHQEYWVLDHADDNSWLIMATPGGNFVWLMARNPVLPKAALAAATARVAGLGYSAGRLIYGGVEATG
jgi:apolipoprotein D and lipocalin family protein